MCMGSGDHDVALSYVLESALARFFGGLGMSGLRVELRVWRVCAGSMPQAEVGPWIQSCARQWTSMLPTRSK